MDASFNCLYAYLQYIILLYGWNVSTFDSPVIDTPHLFYWDLQVLSLSKYFGRKLKKGGLNVSLQL